MNEKSKIKNNDTPKTIVKAGIRYRFLPISNPSIETSFSK